MKTKWWVNDKRKQRIVEKKLDRGADNYDKFERKSDKTIDQFDAETSRAYTEAKGRSGWICKALSFEEAGKAIRIMMRSLGKKPDINYNQDQGGHWMSHRHVLFGVNLEDGIEVSNALVAAGMKDFWITSAGWLTIRMPRGIFVSSFLGPEDDPLVWQAKQTQRENAGKVRVIEKRLDGKVA
jgi:hypothetical protein